MKRSWIIIFMFSCSLANAKGWFFKGYGGTSDEDFIIHTTTADQIDQALAVDTMTLRTDINGLSSGGLPPPDFALHITTADSVDRAVAVDTTALQADIDGLSSGGLPPSDYSIHIATADPLLEGVRKSTGILMSQLSIFGSTTANRSEWNLSKSSANLLNDVQNSSAIAYYQSMNSTMSAVRTDTSTLLSLIKTTSSELSDVTNAINTETNPVSWNSLKDVPAGFADGSDATGAPGGGLPEADWNIFNSTSMLKDLARSNIVASSDVYCAMIPTVEVAVATITITPVLATSKIKLSASFTAVKDLAATARTIRYQIRRGILRTDPQVGPRMMALSYAVAQATFMPAAIFAIDSPGVTTAVTYTIGANTVAGISSYTAYNMIAEEIPVP